MIRPCFLSTLLVVVVAASVHVSHAQVCTSGGDKCFDNVIIDCDCFTLYQAPCVGRIRQFCSDGMDCAYLDKGSAHATIFSALRSHTASQNVRAECRCQDVCLNGGSIIKPTTESTKELTSKKHGAAEKDVVSPPTSCQCNCPEPWTGSLCEECGIQDCAGGGILDKKMCQCTQCPPCENGELQSDCTCDCNHGWKGTSCNVCGEAAPRTCHNGGIWNQETCQCECPHKCQHIDLFRHTTDEENDCACSCIEPWTGPLCDICDREPIQCENGSVWSDELCACDCGALADQCQNGGLLTETCSCMCRNQWSGASCDSCSLQENSCRNGGSVNLETCNCDCNDAVCGELPDCKPGGSGCEACICADSTANMRDLLSWSAILLSIVGPFLSIFMF